MLPCPSALPLSFLLLLLLLSLSLSSAHSSSPSPPPSPPANISIYDLLPKFGLPRGLLPEGVNSYSVSDNGSFVVELGRPCYVHFDYLVYFHRRITGTLTIGGILDIDGIEARKFLVWMNVYEIRVDLPPSDFIYFQVGWVTKKLPVKQFRTVRSCGDGVGVMGRRCGGAGDIIQIAEPQLDAPMLVTK